MIVQKEEENLLVKLIDFNTALEIKEEGQIQDKTGFVPFRAPEMCPESAETP